MGYDDKEFLGLGTALIGLVGSPVVLGAAALGAVAYGMCKIADEHEESIRQARNQSFSHGYRSGAIATKKKMIRFYDENENTKVGIFALGVYVARLDHYVDPREQLKIQEYIGRPDAAYVENRLARRFQGILKAKLSFNFIVREFLNKMTISEIRELDAFVVDIIKADNFIANEEIYFYENQWVPYCHTRGLYL